MATTVFVYGSLKAGHSAHGLLNGAERLADGVLDGVQCIEHEGYPMLVAGDDAIGGEVYRVNAEQLLTLDAYEEASLYLLQYYGYLFFLMILLGETYYLLHTCFLPQHFVLTATSIAITNST